MVTLLLFALIGCSSGTGSNVSNKPKPKPKITAQYIVDTLKTKEGNYMTNITVVTAENDENKLLGRPNQYVQKITWKDSRSKDSNVDCSVEFFNNKEDATARKTYIQNIIKSMPMLTQYIEQNNKALLRIDGVLTPDQSKEYMDIFKTINGN
jgi:hypothetical protein